MQKKLLTIAFVLSGTLTFGLDLSNESYEIKSKYSGNCLKVESSNAVEGSKLIQGSCSEDDNRTKFTFSKLNDKYYTISNANGLYLSVAGDSKSNGINIILSNNPTQFKINKVKNDYKIEAKNSSKYLTIEYTSNDVVQFSKHNNTDQLWSLVSNNSENENNFESELIIFNNLNYYTVLSPITGKIWLDRNLGAESICTSSTDSSCYGGYYDKSQRLMDNICPTGYKVPSWNELSAETVDDSIQDIDINNDGNIEVTNSNTAFRNFLKLPASGIIYSSGAPNYTGTIGFIWSTSSEGLLQFNRTATLSDNNYQSNRFPIRCMKE